jgi:hypothetical protein
VGKHILGFLIFLAVMLSAICAASYPPSVIEYYVDFENGSNTNDGLSPDTPKKTHPYDRLSPWTCPVTGTTYVYLKKGVVYRGFLDINNKSGYSSDQRTVTTYKEGFGTGNPPEIRGSTLYNNDEWTQDCTYANTYSKDFGTTKVLLNNNRNFGVWEDNSMMIGVSTLDKCNNTPGTFFHDSSTNRMYIHTYETDDPDNHATEVATNFNQSVVAAGILLRGVTRHLTFRGITISRFRNAGIYVNTATASEIRFEYLVVRDNDMGVYSRGTSMEYSHLTIIRNLGRGFYVAAESSTLRDSLVAANALNSFDNGIEGAPGSVLSLQNNNSVGNGDRPMDSYRGTYTDLGGNISKTPHFKQDYGAYSKFSFGIDDGGNGLYAASLAQVLDGVKDGPRNAPLTLFYSARGSYTEAVQYAQQQYGLEVGNHTTNHAKLEINDWDASVEFFYNGPSPTATVEITSDGVLRLVDSSTSELRLAAYHALSGLKAAVLTKNGWTIRYAQYGNKRDADDLLETPATDCKNRWARVNAVVDQRITIGYFGDCPTATVEVTDTDIIFRSSDTVSIPLGQTRLEEFSWDDLLFGWTVNYYGFSNRASAAILQPLSETNAKNVNVEMVTPITKYYELEVGTQGDYIEDTFGQRPVSFAYPNGDYREDSDELLAALGIQSARTVDMAFNLESALLNKVDLYFLSNLNVGGQPIYDPDEAHRWGHYIATILNLYPIFMCAHWYKESDVMLVYADDLYQTIIENTNATVDTQGNCALQVMAQGIASSDGYRYSRKISSDIIDIEPGNLSPEVDAGIEASQSGDAYGNPIYGTPDIGAVEHQPAFAIGVDRIDTAGSIRIYQDGRYRYTNVATDSSTAALDIKPSGGFPSGDYGRWMDVDLETWILSGGYYRIWTETSDASVISDHRVGDLQSGDSYNVTVDSTPMGIYQADAEGTISFTYSGGYSTRRFSIAEVGSSAPTISNPQAADVTAISAVITWTTSMPADGRVDYGTTSSYGGQAVGTDPNTTSHAVTLNGLSPETTYHYRCVSTNAYGTAQTTDLTFATTAVVTEIVIDNTDPGWSNTSPGGATWSVGSSSSVPKIGTNYLYTAGSGSQSSATRKCRWTPNIAVGGTFDVYVYYQIGADLNLRAPYTTYYNGGQVTSIQNQYSSTPNQGGWFLVAQDKEFLAGTAGYVELTNASTDTKNVSADAAKWVLKQPASTPPLMLTVTDDQYTTSTTSLAASWSGSDPESVHLRYEYAVGSTPGGMDVKAWTDADTATSMIITGLSLSVGSTYYISVRATNKENLTSIPMASTGVTVAVPVAGISTAKGYADDYPVYLAARTVTANFSDRLYIEEDDRFSAICVDYASAIVPGIEVEVYGRLGLMDGERALKDCKVITGGTGTAIDPLFMQAGALGGSAFNGLTPGIEGSIDLNNLGLLVTVAGTVTDEQIGYVNVHDGNRIADGPTHTGVRVDTTTLLDPPAQGKHVLITGICTLYDTGIGYIRLLKPRNDSDVVIYD